MRSLSGDWLLSAKRKGRVISSLYFSPLCYAHWRWIGFQANTSILLLFKVQRAGRSSGTCVRILFLYLYIYFRNKSEFYSSLRITKCHLSSGNNLLNSHRSGLQRPLGRLSHHESGYILNILNYALLNLSPKWNLYSFDRFFREKSIDKFSATYFMENLIRRRWRVPRIRPAWQQIRPNHHATRLINPWAQSFSTLAHSSQKFLLLPASTFPKPWHIFSLSTLAHSGLLRDWFAIVWSSSLKRRERRIF